MEEKVGQGANWIFLELMKKLFCSECKWPEDKKIKFDDKGKYCYNVDRFNMASKSGKSVPIKLAQSQPHPGRLRLRSEPPSQPRNAPLQHSRFSFLLHRRKVKIPYSCSTGIVGEGHCPPGSSSWCADGVGFPTPPTTPLPLTSSPPDSSSGRQQKMMNLYLFFGFFITFMTYFCLKM